VLNRSFFSSIVSKGVDDTFVCLKVQIALDGFETANEGNEVVDVGKKGTESAGEGNIG
jgi:hypothetical protein